MSSQNKGELFSESPNSKGFYQVQRNPSSPLLQMNKNSIFAQQTGGQQQPNANFQQDSSLKYRNSSLDDERFPENASPQKGQSVKKASHAKTRTSVDLDKQYYIQQMPQKEQKQYLNQQDFNRSLVSNNKSASNGQLMDFQKSSAANKQQQYRYHQRSSYDFDGRVRDQVQLDSPVKKRQQQYPQGGGEYLPPINDRGSFFSEKKPVKRRQDSSHDSPPAREVDERNSVYEDQGVRNSMFDMRIRHSEQKLNQVYSHERDPNGQMNAVGQVGGMFNQKYYLRSEDEEFRKKIIRQNQQMMEMFESMKRNHQKEIQMLKQREAHTFELLLQQQNSLLFNRRQDYILPPTNFFLPPPPFQF